MVFISTIPLRCSMKIKNSRRFTRPSSVVPTPKSAITFSNSSKALARSNVRPLTTANAASCSSAPHMAAVIRPKMNAATGTQSTIMTSVIAFPTGLAGVTSPNPIVVRVVITKYTPDAHAWPLHGCTAVDTPWSATGFATKYRLATPMTRRSQAAEVKSILAVFTACVSGVVGSNISSQSSSTMKPPSELVRDLRLFTLSCWVLLNVTATLEARRMA
mmetsp:Transcript_12973/g.47434  ORF Transcript_12973/g.47434 Transcript_12973/m.47434 type:complete len:217 (-) Transcript_12973:239-889(-)